MSDFRLANAVLIAGVVAGLVLAGLQLVIIGPLIRTAEQYELAAHATHGTESVAAPADPAPAEWEPADGVERTMYTVLGTVLTSVAYAALLLGVSSLLGFELDARRGLLMGLAGFVVFTLAPALGLPPKPPGVAGAELRAAQTWWVATAVASAFGLTLLAKARGRWLWWVAGVVLIAVPHVVGAPESAAPASAELEALSVRFAVTSVATQGAFWLLLGVIGGHLLGAARRNTR